MKTEVKKTVSRWGIAYKRGLYVGQHLTRRDAIEDHIEMLYFPEEIEEKGIFELWERQKEKGDRVVKLLIDYQYE